MNNSTMKKRHREITNINKEIPVKKPRFIVCAALLLFSFSASAQFITFNYTGEVTDIGSSLTGAGVSVGTAMSGSFSYDTGAGGSVASFSTSFANGFTANLGPSGGAINVQNDQMNGSATLPADGFTVFASNTSSNSLNGFSNPDMQFGVLQENAAGQLWDDELPPGLNDWALITLAAINGPDWRWLDFNIPGVGTFDDQIRWAVTEYSVSAVPVPAAIWLFGSALIGFIGFSRRVNIA